MPKDYRRNCFKCKFFYITWDPKHPNGCRAMGFKTRQLPSVLVFASSGKPCALYQEKDTQSPDPS
ncbi:MAG: uracil-DNA glycosylase [Proteobacteria bacterium]|nr:uracil-DNA glycosylase [Pseudomonadota bacterium]MBU1386992.1 uracil-DNA glycosylase [Pseudomonadota bacterium]MBU1542327.1 uracil-DNA glycosylase [Pseudomonadota bacterium]MBU2430739.1 uracil-DNA glycosylase [Pseudomonadota bacterium]MBU2481790.1 uracil-DNA glycosylase [Pseudomonadota bacterium]